MEDLTPVTRGLSREEITMRVGTTLVAVLGTVSLFAVGCSSGFTAVPADTDVGSTESALDQENGGMTTANVSPEFGDPKVQSVPAFDTAMADASDMTTESARGLGAKSFHIALLWGHLPTPRDAADADVEPAVVDWTGSVSVDRGAIGVKKTLAFDARDKVEARTAPNTVSFDSHTLPFVDGLFLRVVVPHGASTILHFKTQSLTTDIDLSQLDAKAGGVIRLADQRDGLAYMGYADVAGCSRGLAFGRWVKMRARLGGLRGRVIDDEGTTIGHVRGIWGHAPRADKDVFFGKYISSDGTHKGLFGGTYGDGEAKAIWATREPREVGGLQLFYSDGYDKDDGRGVWLGRWTERCAL